MAKLIVQKEPKSKPAGKRAKQPAQRVTPAMMKRSENELGEVLCWGKALPTVLYDKLKDNMAALVDNWETIAAMIKLTPEESVLIEDRLQDNELIDAVSLPYRKDKGYVVKLVGGRVGVLKLGNTSVNSYTQVPEHIAMQLGMLKLQDVGTYVRDCGYRHSETLFFVMEKKDE